MALQTYRAQSEQLSASSTLVTPPISVYGKLSENVHDGVGDGNDGLKMCADGGASWNVCGRGSHALDLEKDRLTGAQIFPAS
mgnify:CR=1 FL=1